MGRLKARFSGVLKNFSKKVSVQFKIVQSLAWTRENRLEAEDATIKYLH